MISRRVVLILLAIEAVGCGGTDSEDRSVPPLIPLDTILTIRSDRLWSVQAVRFAKERYVVANGGSREVFVFDHAGNLEKRFGRQGQGPGEFGYIADVAVTGDSVYVLDSLLRRITLFVDGTITREWSLRSVAGAATRLAVAADGQITVAMVRTSQEYGSPPGPNYHRDVIQFVTLMASGSDTQWHDRIAIDGTERMTRFVGQATYHMLPPYRADVSVDLTTHGIVATEHRSGWTRFLTWNGDSTTLWPAVSVTTWVSDAELRTLEADVERRVRRLREIGGEAELFQTSARAAIERWNGEIPRPVFESLKSDGQMIAVQRYDPGDSHSTEWLVLDRSGQAYGRWILPSNARLLTIDGLQLAVVARDSLDAETVHILSIDRAVEAR